MSRWKLQTCFIPQNEWQFFKISFYYYYFTVFMFILHSVREFCILILPRWLKSLVQSCSVQIFLHFLWKFILFPSDRITRPFSTMTFPCVIFSLQGRNLYPFLSYMLGPVLSILIQRMRMDVSACFLQTHIDDVTVLLIKMIGAVEDSDYVRFCLLEGLWGSLWWVGWISEPVCMKKGCQ